MTIRVLAFARLRELLTSDFTIEVRDGGTVGDAWTALVRAHPALHDLAETTRIARNGTLAAAAEPLSPGDELALLPPVGGG